MKTYNQKECAAFCKTKEAYGVFSNFAAYPLSVNGILIRTSEALYQACKFPYDPEIQQQIIDAKSPMTAKMITKPHQNSIRSDWKETNVKIMKWCLKVKLATHFNNQILNDELKSSIGKEIVELSKRDDFWGAKPQGENTLVGHNMLGRLWTELRDTWLKKPHKFKTVKPLKIDDFLLLGKPIRKISK